METQDVAVMEKMCETIEDLLDVERSITSHSSVRIETNNVFDRAPESERIKIVDFGSRVHDNRWQLTFGFSCNFKRIKKLLAFLYHIYMIARMDADAMYDYVGTVTILRAVPEQNRFAEMMGVSVALKLVGYVIKNMYKELEKVPHMRMYMINLYRFCSHFYQPGDRDMLKMFKDFSEYFRFDDSDRLFLGVKNHVTDRSYIGKNTGKSFKNVKLTKRQKKLLQDIVFDDRTLERIKDFAYLQTNCVGDSSFNRFDMQSNVWSQVKIFRKEIAEQPRMASAMYLRTFFDSEYVFAVDLGLFHSTPDANPEAEPMEVMLFFYGEIYWNTVRSLFHRLLGGRYDDELIEGMFDSMIANTE